MVLVLVSGRVYTSSPGVQDYSLVLFRSHLNHVCLVADAGLVTEVEAEACLGLLPLLGRLKGGLRLVGDRLVAFWIASFASRYSFER